MFMKTFYDFLLEAPQPPATSPEPAPPAGGLGAAPPPYAPPGGPPMAPPGPGMPDMGMGAPDMGMMGGGAPPNASQPVSIQKSKSISVWDALEKIINKNRQPSKKMLDSEEG